MMMRTMLATVLLGACSVGAAEKPNLLFIFADDYSYEAVHAAGMAEIETPNIDRLMASGTSFTHAYNSGGWHGAICVASRTMLMTGRQLWHAEAAEKTLKKDFVDQGKLWPQLMKAEGYETYMTGKWHVGAKAEEAFDHARNIRPGMPGSVAKAYNRPLEGKEDPWDPTDTSLGGFWQGGTHWSVVGANDAIDFLGMAKKNEKPFFIYLAFNAPHDPRQAPQEYLDKYPVEKVAVPENFLERYPYCDEMQAPWSLRDEKLAPMPRTKHSVQVHRREYYALITHMDAQIGRVLDALEANGQAENTHIVFTADHGLSVGHHGLIGKQNLYDDSVRVPFVLTGPGVEKGRRVAAPIYLQDVIPTALDWAGAETPGHIEFKSLLPFVEGKGEARKSIYGAYRMAQRSVTMEGYKLIIYPAAKKARMFNLEKDPQEMVDLLEEGKGKGKDVAKRLFGELLKLQKEMDDRLELKAGELGLD